MIKLKTLMFEQRYKYKWIELLDYNVPKFAVTGYRLNMKERGQEAMIDESDLKYFLDDQRFAAKYKNSKYLFWVDEVRGGTKKRIYLVYVYRMDNLPADIQTHVQTDSTPHYNLNGAPVYFKLKVDREGGVVKGADSAEAKAAAEKAAKEREAASATIVKSTETGAELGKTKDSDVPSDDKKADSGQQQSADKKQTKGTTKLIIPAYIKPIAKDIYHAINYVFGTNEELFDSAFDKIKTENDAHYVNLEIARLEKDPTQHLESYIRGDFSGDEETKRLQKLAKILGRDANNNINKTDFVLMKNAANVGAAAALQQQMFSPLSKL